MDYETIHNWTAKRAGGRITITGTDLEGRPRKVAGVDTIKASSTGPIATDKNGVQYRLADA